MPRSSIAALFAAFLLVGCASGVPVEETGDAGTPDTGNQEDPKDSLPDTGIPDPNPTPDPTPDPLPNPEPTPPTMDAGMEEVGEDIAEPVCEDLWYPDTDRDNHGDPDGEPVVACAPPPGYAGQADDCDDTTALISPSAPDECDGIDNNCDGVDNNCNYPCPSAERNGVTYLFCAGAGNFNQSIALCQTAGFHLVKIDDGDENAFLLEQAQINGLDETFIGLNDIASGGVFVWHDGSSPNYTNWNDGQPNNSNDQDCAEMHTRMDWAGTWNDEECGSNQDAICESGP